MKFFGAILIALIASAANCAEVLKVAKNGNSIIVTNDAQPWRIDANLCVVRDDTKIACGRVIKAAKAGAVVRLAFVNDAILTGDQVQTNDKKTSRETASVDNSDALRAGPVLGSNLANASISNYDSSSRMGGIVGGEFDMRTYRWLFLSTGLRYIEKGPTTPASAQTQGTFRLDYIELPVHAKAIFDTGMFKPFFYAGPSLGFLVNAKTDLSVGGQSYTSNVKDSFSTIEVAAQIGGGSELSISRSLTLFLGIEYSRGLNNVATGYTDGTSWKSTGIGFYLGLLFNL